MPIHIASDGDSIASIAEDQGFRWETLWDHPQNAELKRLRRTPNILRAGDEVYVPDLDGKSVSIPIDTSTRITRTSARFLFRLQLLVLGEPRAEEPWVLEVDGEEFSGVTGADGILEAPVPGNARVGTLLLREGRESYTVSIGRLDPIDQLSGIQQRLANLGYRCPATGDLDDATRNALSAFQADQDLDLTGEVDAATRDRLAALQP